MRTRTSGGTTGRGATTRTARTGVLTPGRRRRAAACRAAAAGPPSLARRPRPRAPGGGPVAGQGVGRGVMHTPTGPVMTEFQPPADLPENLLAEAAEAAAEWLREVASKSRSEWWVNSWFFGHCRRCHQSHPGWKASWCPACHRLMVSRECHPPGKRCPRQAAVVPVRPTSKSPVPRRVAFVTLAQAETLYLDPTAH